MKSFKKFIFFSVFLAIGFLNIKPAHAVIYCPSGYTYNALKSRCEAPAQCPSGWLDTYYEKCLATAIFTCPEPYAWNPAAFKCLADATCPCGGTLSNELAHCLAPGPTCPSCDTCPSCGKYGWSAPTGQCGAEVECPNCSGIPGVCGVGIVLNGMVKCNSAYGPSIQCPEGYIYGRFREYCDMAAQCPPGGYYLGGAGNHLCVASPYEDPKNDDCNTMVSKPVSVANGKSLSVRSTLLFRGYSQLVLHGITKALRH